LRLQCSSANNSRLEVKMIRRALILVMFAWLFVGCAAIETKRATELSVAGIAYGKAISELVDVTIAERSDMAAASALALSPATPKPADSRKWFDESHSKLVATFKQQLLIKAASRTLEDYFQALGELAGAKPGEPIIESAKGVLESLNAASLALGSSKPITDDQLKRFEGVGGIFLEQLHGKALGDRLRSDARDVGKALVAFENALVGLEGQYEQLVSKNAINEEMERVILPLVNGDTAKKTTWRADFKSALRRRAQPEASDTLNKSRKASAKMQEAWEAAVKGLDSTTQSKLVIKELTTMFEDLAKLR
jgi:hypothetical protein